MADMTFTPAARPTAVCSGGVIQTTPEQGGLLFRITHVFRTHVYLMQISTPAAARNARRPRSFLLAEVQGWLDRGEAVLGQVPLPDEFITESVCGSESRKEDREATAASIRPLITHFDRQENLARHNFTRAIADRANELGVCFRSMQRSLLWFYYFGRVEQCLTRLRPGRRPSATERNPNPSNAQRRTGPKSRLEKVLGPNHFVVQPEDSEDMVASARKSARAGKMTLVQAHEDYMRLDGPFSKRNPAWFQQYINRASPPPVSYRQFRRYVQDEESYDDDLIGAMPSLLPNRRAMRGLLATGPGEVAEIDATGGRVYVVDEKTGMEIGYPYIYLLIDRWSRFIMGIYVTLNPPSWEELKQLLLVSFTSRARFLHIGINTDDTKWPRGRVPAVILADRGSDFLSQSMAEACAKNLLVELRTASPRCPDAKAIVERVFRTLKERMVSRGIKGSYARRPVEYDAKRRAKRSRFAAVNSLTDIYKCLVDVVFAHNNRQHRTLKTFAALTQAGVRPTPIEAYLWGLAHLTGMRSPPFSDDDYRRLLMTSKKATLGSGSLHFDKRRYLPLNTAAKLMANTSSSKRKQIDVSVDSLDLSSIYVPTPVGPWAIWELAEADREACFGTTQEDEVLMAERAALTFAVTANDAFLAEVARKPFTNRKSSLMPPSVASVEQVRALRTEETRRMKFAMSGGSASQVYDIAADRGADPSTKRFNLNRPSPPERLTADSGADDTRRVIDMMRNRAMRARSSV